MGQILDPRFLGWIQEKFPEHTCEMDSTVGLSKNAWNKARSLWSRSEMFGARWPQILVMIAWKSWILDLGSGSKISGMDPRKISWKSWIWIQDFWDGSKKSLLKILDLGSGSKISGMDPRKVYWKSWILDLGSMGQSDFYSDLSSDLSSDLRFCYLPMFAQNIHKALHIPVDLMKTWVLGGGTIYIYIYPLT